MFDYQLSRQVFPIRVRKLTLSGFPPFGRQLLNLTGQKKNAGKRPASELSRQVFPIRVRKLTLSGFPPFGRQLLNLTGQMKNAGKRPASELSRQVSNLNSSDPESDVLPITLRDNFADANIKKLFIYFRPCIF